jgi:hypothetical protein
MEGTRIQDTPMPAPKKLRVGEVAEKGFEKLSNLGGKKKRKLRGSYKSSRGKQCVPIELSARGDYQFPKGKETKSQAAELAKLIDSYGKRLAIVKLRRLSPETIGLIVGLSHTTVKKYLRGEYGRLIEDEDRAESELAAHALWLMHGGKIASICGMRDRADSRWLFDIMYHLNMHGCAWRDPAPDLPYSTDQLWAAFKIAYRARFLCGSPK